MYYQVLRFLIAADKPATGQGFRLQDDGDGPYIASWDAETLGTQPTAGQMAELSDDPLDAILTPLEFIERFTPDEQIAVIAAAKESDALDLWLTKALGAQEIELNGERTLAGMAALVSAGLLTEDRKNEILHP